MRLRLPSYNMRKKVMRFASPRPNSVKGWIEDPFLFELGPVLAREALDRRCTRLVGSRMEVDADAIPGIVIQ